MKIALLISSLGPGGAERVITHMANWWAEKGVSVTLITLNPSPSHYELHEKVEHKPLNLSGESRGLIANKRRITAIRSALKTLKPDRIISFVDQMNILTLLASIGLKTPVIISERIDPNVYRLPKLWEILRRLVYPLTTTLVVQTKNAGTFFPYLPAKKRMVIANPVAQACPSKLESQKNRITAMGRLVPQKGFDLLIEAFAKLAPNYPDWTLVIWGEGALRRVLESRIKHHKLTDRITLPGLTKKTLEALVDSKIFVLPSRFEGFPNVLCEAMSLGLAVIATDCPSGPAEIITPDRDGLLIPTNNVAALKTALKTLIENQNLRLSLRKAAPKAVQKYSPDSIMSQWNDVLTLSLQGKGDTNGI